MVLKISSSLLIMWGLVTAFISCTPFTRAFTTGGVSLSKHFSHGYLNQRRNFQTSLTSTHSPPLLLGKQPKHGNEKVLSEDRNSINRYSAKDWLHNIISLPKSSILKEIRNPVVTLSLWSVVVSFLFKILKNSSHEPLQLLARGLCIGSTCPHALLVSSLGLLLVFRTNSTYRRFTEGLKCWESIISVSRDLSRMIHVYTAEIGAKRKGLLVDLLIAFPYLLRQHISRSSDNVGSEYITRVQKYHPENTNYHAPNHPLKVCNDMAKQISLVPYGDNFTSRERLSLLSKIDKLSDCIGECERIHHTAVPLNYARHSLRSLTIWLFTLPFALVKDLGFMTGPVMAILSWVMFGIYQIGYVIEDPFQGTLQLSIFCDIIKSDVLDGSSMNAGFAQFQNELSEDNNEDDMLVKWPEIEHFDVHELQASAQLGSVILNMPHASNDTFANLSY